MPNNCDNCDHNCQYLQDGNHFRRYLELKYLGACPNWKPSEKPLAPANGEKGGNANGHE
jgi:hypothetical protein